MSDRIQTIKLINADVLVGLTTLADESVDTIITSPPYWGLRDYQNPDQIGLEPTLDEYHNKLLDVTSELKRVLKPTGVMFWNHGDSYASGGGASRHKGYSDPKYPNGRTGDFSEPSAYPQGNIQPKSLFMQNERLIIRMIDEQSWILRNRIIWHKSNGMPSSVTDRFSNKYEPVYMLVKQRKYWFDLSAVRVPHKESSLNRNKYKWNSQHRTHSPNEHRGVDHREPNKLFNPLGKNPGDVWTIPTHPFPESHFATFPPALVEPLIKATCPAEICPVCGVARERIVDIEKIGNEDDSTRNKRPRINNTMREVPEKGWQSKHHTTGWTSCSCGKEFEPGVVLDCFSGAGTTMLAARNLGRSAIGIEISADYCKLSKKRIGFGQSTIDNSIEYIYEEIK